MLIVTFGLPGSGKSYFAWHLARALDIPHLKSDDVRDTLQKRGDYDTESKAMVYEALLNKAVQEEKNHQAVIVDATFHKAWMREMAEQIAEQHQVLLKLIELKADEAIIAQRVQRDRPDSDANFAVYQQLKGEADPLQEEHLAIDSGQASVDVSLQKAYDHLNLHPAKNS